VWSATITASHLCAITGVDIVMTSIVQRQTNRFNTAADNAEGYFHAAVCMTFIDNLVIQLNERIVTCNQLLHNVFAAYDAKQLALF